eukprot:scaffold31831_cov168-Amphora_coffeaeformis.AAC.4
MPPVGFKRSRALWDNARRPYANKWEAVRPWLRAILYELQPIRSSELPGMQGWLRQMGASIRYGVQQLPGVVRMMYTFFAQRTQREWSLAVGALLYYMAVRWIHHALDAGPIVLIITALVGIFTIGLGENTDGISAYSVFNRGFQRLLGEVDAEDLVAQQMGGGMRVHRGGGGGGRDILDPPPPPPQARAARPEQDENNDDGDSSSDDEDANDGDTDNNNNNNRPRARLSGKKARRRNLEQRRELRRQRDAALAMGFGADEQAEALAMQRFLDEQIAENEQ